MEIVGFPSSLGNNKCYDCGALKEDLKQDGYWEKFVWHCGELRSVFICDTCNDKPTLICPFCKWLGNESLSSAKIISCNTAEFGYCPNGCGKCLKFDD